MFTEEAPVAKNTFNSSSSIPKFRQSTQQESQIVYSDKSNVHNLKQSASYKYARIKGNMGSSTSSISLKRPYKTYS